MTDKELIAAMRRLSVETGSLACVGCGREHNCGIHGCAILRAGAERLTELTDELHRATANVGEWVPTEERLPEDDTVCAVLVSGRPMANITLYHALERAEYNHKDGWSVEMWPGWETPTVTHWMPLPDADMEDMEGLT